MKTAFIPSSESRRYNDRMLGSTLSSLVLVVASVTFGQLATVRTFDTDARNQLPSDFLVAAVRQEKPGAWRVERDDGGQVLRHASDAKADGWSLAVVKQSPMANVLVSARVRLAGGTRAGGVVWRYRDERNFHAVVLDLDAQKISAYRVIDGHRVRFDVRDGLELDPGAWYTLKVVHDSSRVSVWLGGIRVLTDEDRRRSRDTPGLAGVLAAGAGDATFDDLRVEPRSGARHQ